MVLQASAPGELRGALGTRLGYRLVAAVGESNPTKNVDPLSDAFVMQPIRKPGTPMSSKAIPTLMDMWGVLGLLRTT